MRPFYFARTTNFGDFMNSWLWPRVLPGMIKQDSDIRLVGIGSLLKNDLARVVGTKVIFGTGSGYGDLPLKETSNTWKFYCVRGPLTAKNFNLDPSLAIVDGSWLINQLPEFATIPSHKSGICFVPHWTSAVYGNWAPVCKLAGLNYINPMGDSLEVINSIARSELAIVESLHGAIIADYFRTPWIPVSSVGGGRVLHFKWLDWCMSVEVPYRTIDLPPSDLVDSFAQRVSTKSAHRSIVAREYSELAFPHREAAPPQQNSSLYGFKQRLKTRANAVRSVALDQLRHIRDIQPLGRWNGGYRAELANYLQQVSKQRSHLSADKLRARKIEQLNAALQKLKNDYT